MFAIDWFVLTLTAQDEARFAGFTVPEGDITFVPRQYEPCSYCDMPVLLTEDAAMWPRECRIPVECEFCAWKRAELDEQTVYCTVCGEGVRRADAPHELCQSCMQDWEATLDKVAEPCSCC